MKEMEEKKKTENLEDKNLANYLKLNYYIENRKIRNAQNQSESVKKEIDIPTEARLIQRLKDLDKSIIPRNNIYLFQGNQLITLKEIMGKLNLDKLKNKKVQQGLNNMTIQKNEKDENEEEIKEMPEILDAVIDEKQSYKKNYAKHNWNYNNNIGTVNDTLTPSPQGDDDCFIF